MSKQHILIVDNNEAFATILKEGIESGAKYDATIATSALEARNMASRGNLAMAIVDMGLEDDDPVELLKTLRQRRQDLRLMCIPAGKMPDVVHGLSIQGILPKPFFLPEIPDQIEQAMARPVKPVDVEALSAEVSETDEGKAPLDLNLEPADVDADSFWEVEQEDADSYWQITPEDADNFWEVEPTETETATPEPEPAAAAPAAPEPQPQATEPVEAEAEPVAAEPPPPEPEPAPAPQAEIPADPQSRLLDHLASETKRLTLHLNSLSRELSAEAVLLICGDNLVAHASRLSHVEAESLARSISESWQASTQVAAALGRKHVRFEQSLHEGEGFLLYSLAASPDVVLSVALRADRPLGMIRYNTKQTVEAIRPFLLPR